MSPPDSDGRTHRYCCPSGDGSGDAEGHAALPARHNVAEPIIGPSAAPANGGSWVHPAGCEERYWDRRAAAQLRCLPGRG